jgi:hypothetical protein
MISGNYDVHNTGGVGMHYREHAVPKVYDATYYC